MLSSSPLASYYRAFQELCVNSGCDPEESLLRIIAYFLVLIFIGLLFMISKKYLAILVPKEDDLYAVYELIIFLLATILMLLAFGLFSKAGPAPAKKTVKIREPVPYSSIQEVSAPGNGLLGAPPLGGSPSELSLEARPPLPALRSLTGRGLSVTARTLALSRIGRGGSPPPRLLCLYEGSSPSNSPPKGL